MELKHCKTCNQMTNHNYNEIFDKWVCLKCAKSYWGKKLPKKIF